MSQSDDQRGHGEKDTDASSPGGASKSRGRRRKADAEQAALPVGNEAVRIPFLPSERVEARLGGTADITPDGATDDKVAVAPPVLPPGFQIRRLRMLGANLPPAELAFRPGLNLVVGASNTGKSFAFYLIDFAFGARQLRKLPPIAQHYDEVVLEIESAAGEWYTVRRAFRSPSARWYHVPYEQIGDPKIPFRQLSARLLPENSKSLNAQYLVLSGLLGLKLQSNQENKTQPLSFRNVLEFCMVDEARIITEGSVVTGPNPNANTPEKSLFDLLLSGRDASDLVAIQSVAARRSRLQAQADLLDSLIERERERLRAGMMSTSATEELTRTPEAHTSQVSRTEPRDPDLAELQQQRERLDLTIAHLEKELEVAAGWVDDARGEREALDKALLADKSRLLVVRELLARFDLLERSYRTDLDRLAFIEIGSELLEQLPAVACPTCGQPLDIGHEHAGEPGVAPFRVVDNVRAACEAEAHTIRTLLRDLEAAVTDLREEAEALGVRIQTEAAGVAEVDHRLRRELQPRMSIATTELRGLTVRRQQVARQEHAAQRLSELVLERHDLARELDGLRKRGARPIPEKRIEASTESLTEQVRLLLHAWSNVTGSVRFDRSAMDFVVGGQTRAAQGKGVRAIWFAAFIIGLMRLSRAERRPHPGFVILDSPLTTFHGGKPRARGPEDVPESVEQAFFRDLAISSATSSRHEQIIIFDNKEPPDDVEKFANVVRFTGYGGGDREGFVPIPEGTNPSEIPSAPDPGSDDGLLEEDDDESGMGDAGEGADAK